MGIIRKRVQDGVTMMGKGGIISESVSNLMTLSGPIPAIMRPSPQGIRKGLSLLAQLEVVLNRKKVRKYLEVTSKSGRMEWI